MFWAAVRAQYELDTQSGVINLENGYFSVQARPVFEAFQRYNAQLNREGTYFLRMSFPDRLDAVMHALSRFTGAAPEELVLTRSTTEAMNILIQGYPFVAGDEVLLASDDYPSVLETVEMMKQRRGLEAILVQLPFDPADDGQVISLYEAAITPRTRVLLLTHLIYTTGQILPVAKIAQMAHAHGIDVFVDAAHSFAHVEWRIPDLHAGFVAVNLHKWLGAPLGLGLLYIRKDRIADIAPLFGDMHHDVGDICKLVNFGTMAPAPVLAIEDAIAFHQQIGGRNKEARLRYLKDYWVGQVQHLPRIAMQTPRASERACAIAAFRVNGMPAREVVAYLFEQYRIFSIARTVAGEECVRITPHLYTSTDELDLLVRALEDLA